MSPQAPKQDDSWIDSYQTPAGIEQPVASARPGGAKPAGKPRTQIPFNDLARTWDPMMPQSQYDDLRFQYFQTHVQPKFRPEQSGAAWTDFKNRTERPKAIESPALAQAKLAVLSLAARSGEIMQNPVVAGAAAVLSSGASLINQQKPEDRERVQQSKDQLIQMMERDGLNTSSAQTVGAITPDLMAFAGIEGATAGAGEVLAAAGDATSIVAKAGRFLQGTRLASRMTRGGLTFGTFQAVTAQQGENPGYAFVSGFGQGTAFEAGLAGLGKLASKGTGKISEELLKKRGAELSKELFTPKETVAEVDATLAKTGAHEADMQLAKKVQQDVAHAKHEGLPLVVQGDYRAWKPVIRGVQGDGRPFSIEVPPHQAYGQPSEELKQILKGGGQVQLVSSSPLYPGDAVQVLSMLRDVQAPAGSYQLKLLESVVDKYGYNIPDEGLGEIFRPIGGTGPHSNAISVVGVKEQFLTGLQRGMQHIDQVRASVAELAQSQEALARLSSEASGPNAVDSGAALTEARARLAKARSAVEAAKKAAQENRMLPGEGATVAGGKQFAEYTMRNGIPGAHGIMIDVAERDVPENGAQSALLNRGTRPRSLYLRADGSLAEYKPADGAPTDYWHPNDGMQRQTAWKLVRQYMDKAAGGKDAVTLEAQQELQNFVQKSVMESAPGFKRVQQVYVAGAGPEGSIDGYRAGHFETRFITSKPLMPDVLVGMTQHETPAGMKLSRTEATVAAKQIMQLWSQNSTRAAKEAAADGLKNLGVEGWVPQEWKYWVRNPEGEIIKTAPSMQGEPPKGKWQYSDVARLWSQEGSPALGQIPENFMASTATRALMERTGLPASKLKTFADMYKNGAPVRKPQALLADPGIPAVDVLRSQERTKYRRNIRDIVLGRTSFDSIFDESFKGGFGGAVSTESGKFGVAGTRYLPDDLQGRLNVARSLYHEDLHLQLNALRQASPQGDVFARILDAFSSKRSFRDEVQKAITLTDIQHGLARAFPDYELQGHDSLLEEAWVHAATAIRTADRVNLRRLADWDTSEEHVRQMVDSVAEAIKGKLDDLPDAQELRHMKTRMDDLMRRTGPERFSRWLEEAQKQELNMHIDPETFDVVFQDARGNTTHVMGLEEAQTLKLVPDYLERMAGFEENVPSSTVAFENMGWRSGIAAGKSLVQGTGERPTAYMLPKSSDNFKGIRATAAVFEPMLGWAARAESAFKARGQDLGLFDAVKSVDDATRLGAQWHDDQLTTAAKFITPNVEHAKMLTTFMSVDPENWPKLATKMGLDDKFLANAKAAQQWLVDFRVQTGIDAQRYFKVDLPKLQNMNYSVQAVWPKGLDRSELARIPKAIVDGDLNPQDPHFGHTVAWLIREGYEAKFTQEPLRKLTKLMNATDAEGKSILGPMKYNVDNYVKYIKGVPDASQQIILKTVGDFQKGLGKAFGEVNKKFGTKLPEDFNYPGDLLQKYMLLSYVGAIGLRPAIAIRDAMQGVTNTLPVMGPAKFIKGIQALFRKGAWQEAMDAGALLGRHNVQGLYGDIYQELGPQSGGALDKGVEIVGRLLAPSRWGHNVARAVAYHGELDSALEAVKALRSNKIDAKELMERTSMWFFDAPLQTRLLKQVMDKTSEAGYTISHEDMARKIALEAVDHTLWAYRRGTQPLFLRTGVGRIFGQYGLWPMSYLDFLRRMASKLPEHPQKAMYAMGLWYGANKAASATFSTAGGDVSKWFFISPAGYGGSPHLQMAQAVGESFENSEQGRAARKTVLEYPMNFIPAFLELKNVSRLIGEGGQFFNDDWSLTDNAVRVMGMHPKSTELELTPEEKIEYEMGFSHRR